METLTSATSTHLGLKKPSVNLKHLPLDYTKNFYANAKEHPWIKEIIEDFNIAAEGSMDNSGPGISVNISVQKRDNSLYGEHVLVKGHLKSKFLTECVRCLDPVQEIVEDEFNICYLNEKFAKSKDYEETLSLFIDDSEHDLYLYTNNSIELKDFIYEIITLNKGPFPLHDENCKGLCQICGENLNKIRCIHTK